MDGSGDHNVHRKSLAGVVRQHSGARTAANHATTNLRDLLKGNSLIDDGRENDKSAAGDRCMTLAAAFANDASDGPSSSSSTTRTLFEVIRDEKELFPSTASAADDHNHNHNKTHIVNWRTFKNRLLLRHVASSFSETLNIDTVLPSPSGSTEPVQVSLMTLLNQTDMMGEESKSGGEGKGKDGDENVPHVCCVCMDRHKNASDIPCGHTYCSVCSTELCVVDGGGRGKCPLCNGFALEILNIF